MPDLVKRSLQIITGGVGYAVKDYTSNLESLKNDAEAILSNIKDNGKKTNDTFSRMKSEGIVRKISDWFYQKGTMYDDYDLEDTDEDFDPGFETDDEEEAPQPKMLDTDSMRDVARGQVGAMYKIAGKQTEAGIANTAEIVSSFNSRSSEIVASINNVNTTLIGLSEKLDKVITAVNPIKETESKDNRKDLYDYSGRLTLGGVYDAIKDRATNNSVSMLGSMVPMFLQGGPAPLFGELLKGTVGNIKMGFLGGKSINEIGEKFNDTVEAVTHNTLQALIDSKPFQKIFGNLNTTEANKDYSKLSKNQYTKDPAVFDGMTRYSIIHVIPEYLKKINQNLSGEKYEVDHKGKLTTSPERVFDKVTRSAFSSSGLSYDTTSSIYQQSKAIDINISKSDITEASKVITMVYVMYLYRTGRRSLSPGQITSNDTNVIDQAVRTLVNASGKSADYWGSVCMTVMHHLSTNVMASSDFVSNVNKQLREMDKKATEVARDERFASQVGPLSYDLAENQFINHYKKDIMNSSDDKEDESPKDKNVFKRFIKDIKDGKPILESGKEKDKKSEDSTVVKEKPVQQQSNHNYTMLDYSRGIFGILNRGINVRVTNSNDDLKPYENYEITRTSVTMPFSERFNLKSGVDKVSDDNGGWMSSMVDKLVPKGIRISMQKFANAFGLTGNKNESNENGEGPITITPRHQIGEKVHKLIDPTLDKVKQLGNAVIGESVENFDGSKTRQGGIIQGIGNRISNKVSKVKADVSRVVNDKLDDMIVKRDYEQTVKDVNNIVPENEEQRQDQLKAQNIFALMQTSVEDGDTSTDIGAITQQINSIRDSKLKQQLQNSVIPMLQRSGKKTEKNTGFLGKVVSGALGGIKKIFSPVLSVLRMIFSGIKKIGSKILSPVKKGIKSGLSDIKTGASSVFHGLFGQKAKYSEDLTEIQQASDGLIKRLLVKPLKLLTNVSTKVLKGITKTTTKFYTTAGDYIKNGVSWLKEKTSPLIENISKKVGSLTKKISSFFNRSSDDNKKSSSSKTKSGFGSSFVEGFKSAFKKVEDEKEKKRIESLKVETISDVKTGNIEEMISGKSDSVFSKLLSFVEEIRDSINKNKESNNSTTSDVLGNVVANDTGTNEGTSSVATSFQVLDNKDDKPSTTSIVSTTNGSPQTYTPGGDFKKEGTSSKVSVVGADSGGGTGKSSGGIMSKLGGAAGLGFDMGKTLGGILNVMQGIAKILMTIVAATKVVEVIGQLINQIFDEGLKPLAQVGQAVFEALKPIADGLTEIVSVLMDCLGKILVSVVDVISPILEAIMPAIDTILGILTPILDVINVAVKLILAPLMGVVQYVLVPVLNVISGCLEVIMGVLQTGIGLILTALGAIITGVGLVVKTLTLGLADGIYEKGKEMTTMGWDMAKSGMSSVVTGSEKVATSIINALPGVNVDEEKEETKVTQPKNNEPVKLNGSVMDGIVVGSGDTISNDDHRVTNNIYNTYGSGPQSQGSYGPYMNMGARGCGPIALADAYNRRTGRNVDPRSLASQMGQIGTYNPNAGTSVGGFVDTGRSMGMNMRVGGVTQDSLKQARPNNPITVIGSGSDYGTRKGNNHYVNVVGTDRNGGAYVSNPLTGRVERRSISTLANSSVMGLYGSGDEDTGIFKFDDSVTSAMKELVDYTGGILSMFDFDSKENEVQEAMDKEKEKASVDQTKKILGEENYEAYEDKAREAFQKSNPKRKGETDEAYEKRFQQNKDKYMLQVTNEDAKNKTSESWGAVSSAVKKTGEFMFGKYDEKTGDFSGDGFANSFVKAADKDSASQNNGGEGTISSSDGVVLGTSSYKPTITSPNVTKNEQAGKMTQTPLHEFFAKTTGSEAAWSVDGNFFMGRSNPDSYGQGSEDVDPHNGIDILVTGGNSNNKPLYATTSGTVVGAYGGVTRDSMDCDNGGAGNYIIWKDEKGHQHRYLHMHNSTPLLNPGDPVEGGKTIMGYMGNTGASTGHHLHYDIDKGTSNYNPIKFFSKFNASEGGSSGTLTGNSDSEKIWNNLVGRGLSKYGVAGLMGNLKAESNLQSNNLQNSYESSLGYSDEAYTKAVDSGKYDNFVHDAAGYGLAQWTYWDRKQGLFDFAKNKNSSIGDLGMQLDYLYKELQDRPSIFDTLSQAASVREASDKVLTDFENPADQSERVKQLRASYGQEFYDLYSDMAPSSAPGTSSMGGGSTISGSKSWWSPQSADDALWVSGRDAVVTTQDTDLNMRSGPNMDSDVIASIPRDTEIFASYPRDLWGTEWYKVSYDGKEGYAHKDYIKGLPSSTVVSNKSSNNKTTSKNNITALGLVQNATQKLQSSQNNSNNQYDGSGLITADTIKNQARTVTTTTTAKKGEVKPIEYYSSGLISPETAKNQQKNYTTTSTTTAAPKPFDPNYYSTYGSGDIDSNDLIYKTISGFGDYDNISNIIPPIDDSKFETYPSNDQYNDYGQQPAIINNYNIQTNETDRKNRLRAILSNTYNVRAEKIEKLLEIIIEKMDNNSSTKKPTTAGSNQTTDLFSNDEIPSQLVRLYSGE